MLQQPRAAVQGDRPTALVHAREGVGRACKASALPTTTLARTNNYKGGFNKKLGVILPSNASRLLQQLYGYGMYRYRVPVSGEQRLRMQKTGPQEGGEHTMRPIASARKVPTHPAPYP